MPSPMTIVVGLTIMWLIVVFALSVSLALLRGGVAWPIAVAFAGGLGGYLYFLRSQARRDREHRQFREPQGDREDEAAPVQAEADTDGPAPRPAVLIDDDDPALE